MSGSAVGGTLEQIKARKLVNDRLLKATQDDLKRQAKQPIRLDKEIIEVDKEDSQTKLRNNEIRNSLEMQAKLASANYKALDAINRQAATFTISRADSALLDFYTKSTGVEIDRNNASDIREALLQVRRFIDAMEKHKAREEIDETKAYKSLDDRTKDALATKKMEEKKNGGDSDSDDMDEDDDLPPQGGVAVSSSSSNSFGNSIPSFIDEDKMEAPMPELEDAPMPNNNNNVAARPAYLGMEEEKYNAQLPPSDILPNEIKLDEQANNVMDTDLELENEHIRAALAEQQEKNKEIIKEYEKVLEDVENDRDSVELALQQANEAIKELGDDKIANEELLASREQKILELQAEHDQLRAKMEEQSRSNKSMSEKQKHNFDKQMDKLLSQAKKLSQYAADLENKANISNKERDELQKINARDRARVEKQIEQLSLQAKNQEQRLQLEQERNSQLLNRNRQLEQGGMELSIQHANLENENAQLRNQNRQQAQNEWQLAQRRAALGQENAALQNQNQQLAQGAWALSQEHAALLNRMHYLEQQLALSVNVNAQLEQQIEHQDHQLGRLLIDYNQMYNANLQNRALIQHLDHPEQLAIAYHVEEPDERRARSRSPVREEDNYARRDRERSPVALEYDRDEPLRLEYSDNEEPRRRNRRSEARRHRENPPAALEYNRPLQLEHRPEQLSEKERVLAYLRSIENFIEENPGAWNPKARAAVNAFINSEAVRFGLDETYQNMGVNTRSDFLNAVKDAIANVQSNSRIDPRTTIRGKGIKSTIAGKGVGKIGKVSHSPSYSPLGNTHYLSMGDLGECVLKIVYSNGTAIKNLPRQRISKDLQDIMYHIVEMGKVPQRLVEKLSEKERALLSKVSRITKTARGMGVEHFIESKVKHDLDRFELLQGMIQEGNDSLAVIRELRTLTRKLMDNDHIKKSLGTKILASLA